MLDLFFIFLGWFSEREKAPKKKKKEKEKGRQSIERERKMKDKRKIKLRIKEVQKTRKRKRKAKKRESIIPQTSIFPIHTHIHYNTSHTDSKRILKLFRKQAVL